MTAGEGGNLRGGDVKCVTGKLLGDELETAVIHYIDRSNRMPLLIIEFRCFNQTHCHKCIKQHLAMLTNICERMGHSEGLSELKCGAVTGCYLCHKKFLPIPTALFQQ